MTSHTSGDMRIAGLLHAYLHAEYRWEHRGNWYEVFIGLPAPGLELAYPQAGTFGMLSAWNPGSVTRPDETNRASDDALRDEMQARGWRFVPAFASAPNRTWREPSWLVFDLAPADFDALSRRYGQLGTLWWRAGEPVRMRMAADRPASGVDASADAHVDWIGPPAAPR